MTALSPLQAATGVQAVVFDMDGVLLLSSAIHDAAFRKVLEGRPVRFRYADYAGMRTQETVEAILRDNGLPAPPDEIAALARRKSELALAWIEERNPVAPAARSVLEHLAGRYSLALATSASPATVACFLERNGLRRFFGPVLTGAEVLKAKPDPEIYLRSAALLGVPPSECLVIEDAVAGVKSAKAAGSVVCALAGVASHDALRDAGADYAIDDLEELTAL